MKKIPEKLNKEKNYIANPIEILITDKVNEILNILAEEREAREKLIEDIKRNTVSIKERIDLLEQNVEELITKQQVREGTIKSVPEQSAYSCNFCDLKNVSKLELNKHLQEKHYFPKDSIAASQPDDNSDDIELFTKFDIGEDAPEDGFENQKVWGVQTNFNLTKQHAEATRDRLMEALDFYEKYKEADMSDVQHNNEYLQKMRELGIPNTGSFLSKAMDEVYSGKTLKHDDDADWEGFFDEVFADKRTWNDYTQMKYIVCEWIQSARNDALMQGLDKEELKEIRAIVDYEIDYDDAATYVRLSNIVAKLDKILEEVQK